MFNIEAFAVILDKMPVFVYWLFWSAVGFIFFFIALTYARKTWQIIRSEYAAIKHRDKSSSNDEW